MIILVGERHLPFKNGLKPLNFACVIMQANEQSFEGRKKVLENLSEKKEAYTCPAPSEWEGSLLVASKHNLSISRSSVVSSPLMTSEPLPAPPPSVAPDLSEDEPPRTGAGCWANIRPNGCTRRIGRLVGLNKFPHEFAIAEHRRGVPYKFVFLDRLH
jgi:hypothetical protein